MTISGLISDLRETINGDPIITTHQAERLFYHQAPRDSEFPYSVYQFGSEDLTDAEPITETVLTIDTWDYSTKADRAIVLSERIKQLVHRTFASSDVAFFWYRGRSALPTGSEDVYRTSMVFEVLMADAGLVEQALP